MLLLRFRVLRGRCTRCGLLVGRCLGLRLIQQIVAERKGYLDIESEPGEGSSFTVNFSEKRERKSVC